MRLREITKKKNYISPSGVETDMDPRDDDYEINYGKHGTVAKHRKELGPDVETGTRKIKEDGEFTAVMAFGRMNPPTIGHQKLVDKIKSLPGDPYLFLSQSQKPKTDPLDFQTKLRFAKFFFPGVTIGSPEVKTIVQALQKVEQLGYKNLIYVAGSDRVQDFTNFINKYNEIEPHFDSVEVVSAGERDPDAKGAEGMSASKMRELARAEEFKQFAQGVPDEKLADELYNAVRKGMGLTQGDLEMSDSREFRDYIEHIESIVREHLKEFEDYEMADPDEDEGLEDESFKGMPMYDQLGKLLDSQDSPRPINAVTTDDGEEHEVSADQARALRLLATTEKVKPEVKKSFLRDIQDSQGLVNFLDQTDYHEMAHLFVKRYLH
jgi:hypothetical protein